MRSGTGLELGPLEIASGSPLGADEEAPPLPPPHNGGPRAALHLATVRALERPPCIVSFSGGRDSSAILALAMETARLEGLPAPIPITLRFPGSRTSNETEWQERVVGHLKVDEWVRQDVSDELDLVGPIAGAQLRRWGPLWPPNTHFHQPILERAAGGSSLTGIDGDGIFASWHWRRPVRVLAERRRPTAKDLLRLLAAASPPLVRRAAARARPPRPLPWLRPATMTTLARAWSRDSAAEPVRWNHWVPWYARQRAQTVVFASFDLLAGAHDVRAVHPFFDPVFLSTLGRAGGATGYGRRTDVMRTLFGDLLPDDLLSRPTKATMDDPFWNVHSRAFVAAWDGSGVDAELVDVEGLRHEWQKPIPHAATSTLLQTAWLSTQTRHERA